MGLAQLAVFVRPSTEGKVKTRLQPRFGASGATALYEAFVEDALALCARVRDAGRVDLALWSTELDGPGVGAWGRTLGVVPRLQPEGELGERLAAAFDEGLRDYERVVIIGSDLPTLPFRLIASAFDALESSPLALGPANDGGYYLIGASHGLRPRFEDVRWSTSAAFADTVRANQGTEIATLPPWYDVDDESDLEVLRAHLSVQPKAAPATARCLASLGSLKDRA
jgi:rSAM/selenodomain-associated transferase 1